MSENLKKALRMRDLKVSLGMPLYTAAVTTSRELELNVTDTELFFRDTCKEEKQDWFKNARERIGEK